MGLLVAVPLVSCESAEEPESLCKKDAQGLPVAEWFEFEDGVIAAAGSSGGLPSWSLRIFFEDEILGGEAEERISQGVRCWSLGNGYMSCDVAAGWAGVVSADLCGDRLVYELHESDWGELPPGVYEFEPRSD